MLIKTPGIYMYVKITVGFHFCVVSFRPPYLSSSTL